MEWQSNQQRTQMSGKQHRLFGRAQFGERHKWHAFLAPMSAVRQMCTLLSVYFTDVIREVNLQSLDQQAFLNQLLVQRLDGPGEETHGLCHQHTLTHRAMTSLKYAFIYANKWVFEIFLQFRDKLGFLKTVFSANHVHIGYFPLIISHYIYGLPRPSMTPSVFMMVQI